MALLLCCTIPPAAEAAKDVAEKRECAICHIAWMSDFKRQDVVTLIPYEPRPLEETGRQDVVSTERMCFSCHDGFVLDSRPQWLADRHSHPVGVKPSDKVLIPMQDDKIVFPMNEEGKVYCGTCHSAHGLSWQEKRSPIFLRIPNVDSSLCRACHENRASGEPGTNHPVFRQLDSIPEKLLSAGGQIGENDVIICQSCHAPHAARGKPLMVVDNRSAGLCRNCHKDKGRVVETKHDLGLNHPETTNRKGESVLAYGPCLVCHVIHEADTSAPLWGRDPVLGQDVVKAVCESCHNSDGPARQKIIADHSHPTLVSVAKLGITAANGKWDTQHPLDGKAPSLQPLPLFDADGHRNPEGTHVTCLSCHDPHRWSALPEPAADAAGAEGDGDTSFLRIAQGRHSALCVNCHVDKRPVLKSKHNLDIMGSQVRDKLGQTATLSSALDRGTCGACHRVHNGRGPVMAAIRGKAPKGPIQSICTACHTRQGIASGKLTGKHSHPLRRSLSKLGWESAFPLFDDQGQRTPQGTVDCATCHNPHQWDPEDPLSSAGALAKVEGTAGNSFLRRSAAPDPTLCLDCHRDKVWISKTDHDLNVTAPTAKNARGQTPPQSGACGQCHSVHNAQRQLVLWARQPAKVSGAQESLCLGCHRQGAIAAHKAPTKILHPPQVVVWSNRVRAGASARAKLPVTPVFDRHGHRTLAGRLACASCHNPHRWDPREAAKGPGINREGDATNSFLRNRLSGRLVCSDCHGKDAIFRYKYFHGLTSRRVHPLYR